MEVLDKPGYGPWELSADRANAVREILAGEEVSSGHFFMVAGEADTDPLFPDNPYMSPNRRVTITLMREEAPIPADLNLSTMPAVLIRVKRLWKIVGILQSLAMI